MARFNTLHKSQNRVIPTAKVITTGRLVLKTEVAVSTAEVITVAIVLVDIKFFDELICPLFFVWLEG